MATDIFDKPFSDHVVFDRIVDADRNITLARQAADKAEADGKPEKAAVLRAKADHLEALLKATQQPTYDDVDEDPPQGSGSSGTSGNDSSDQQGKGDQGEDQGQGPKADDGDQAAGNGGADDSSDQDSADNDPTQGGGSGDGKTPDDISNIDQHSDSHANGTLKNNQGGPGSSSGGEGGGGGSGGQGSSNNQKQSNGNNSSKNKQKELDPFRRSMGGNSQQGEQPDPQQILDAVIKRLSRLSGNAKVGADRALQQLFDELGGQGDIND